MDINTLSRRELQALCKRNGVRANMTNAAMARALQSLTLVDRIPSVAQRSTSRARASPYGVAGVQRARATLRAAARKTEDIEQQEKPKAIASDVKCDDPGEEQVTKLLGGENKVGKLVEAIGPAVVWDNCIYNDLKVMLLMEEQYTNPQEVTLKEKDPSNVDKSAPLSMEGSTTLGVMFDVEIAVPVIEKGQGQDASIQDGEGLAESSPATEMANDVIPLNEYKEVVVNEEPIKEDNFAVAGETHPSPREILPAAMEEDEISEEDKMTEAKLTDGEANEDVQWASDDDCLYEDEEWASDDGKLYGDWECASDDDLAAEEIGSTEQKSVQEICEANKKSDSTLPELNTRSAYQKKKKKKTRSGKVGINDVCTQKLLEDLKSISVKKVRDTYKEFHPAEAAAELDKNPNACVIS